MKPKKKSNVITIDANQAVKHPMQCAKCFRVCRLSDSGKTWVCTICKHREKANGGQAVSDTPMTDEAYFKNSATMYDLAGEMKQIERELNVANEKIEVLLIADCERLRIEEELNAANARIKRLEDCAETAWGIIANVDSGSWQEQRADWREAATRWRDEQFHPELSERKAKEAKP